MTFYFPLFRPGFQTRLYGAGDPLGVHFPNYADNAAPRLLDELGSVSLSGEALVDFMNNSNVGKYR